MDGLDQFAADMEMAGFPVYYESYPDYVEGRLVALCYGPGVVVGSNQMATIEAATTLDLDVFALSGNRIFVCPRMLSRRLINEQP